jgi:DNA-binding PadR family transcriptional regulator
MHRIHSTGEGRCGRGGHSETGHHDMLHIALSHHHGGHGRHGGPGGDHGRHRHRGFGDGPGGGFGGFGGFGGPGGGGPRGRGRKARRGDIRTAALLLLAEEPRNGYQIMQEVEQRSDGAWRPSPGSVYPALQQLEDEGLIRSEDSDGRKLFALTDDGRAHVDHRPDDATAPWEQWRGEVGEDAHQLFGLMRQVVHAFTQVMGTGSKAQMDKASDVLGSARRDLYQILADGEPDAGSGDHEQA